DHRAVVIELALDATGDLCAVSGDGRHARLHSDALCELSDFQMNRNPANLRALQNDIVRDESLEPRGFGRDPLDTRDKVRRLNIARRVGRDSPDYDVRLDIRYDDFGSDYVRPAGVGHGSSNSRQKQLAEQREG